MTKKFGVEAGGFWMSTDGASTWANKTQALYGKEKHMGRKAQSFSNPRHREVGGEVSRTASPSWVIGFRGDPNTADAPTHAYDVDLQMP